ncbi:hypothetical protein DENSPDRAFT_886857 [Dentipellis sp. KUC8613]|nr:hypothetical protein DENSPDRAFT_886857 [Dentipellis sp. KUC8613]
MPPPLSVSRPPVPSRAPACCLPPALALSRPRAPSAAPASAECRPPPLPNVAPHSPYISPTCLLAPRLVVWRPCAPYDAPARRTSPPLAVCRPRLRHLAPLRAICCSRSPHHARLCHHGAVSGPHFAASHAPAPSGAPAHPRPHLLAPPLAVCRPRLHCLPPAPPSPFHARAWATGAPVSATPRPAPPLPSCDPAALMSTRCPSAAHSRPYDAISRLHARDALSRASAALARSRRPRVSTRSPFAATPRCMSPFCARTPPLRARVSATPRISCPHAPVSCPCAAVLPLQVRGPAALARPRTTHPAVTRRSGAFACRCLPRAMNAPTLPAPSLTALPRSRPITRHHAHSFIALALPLRASRPIHAPHPPSLHHFRSHFVPCHIVSPRRLDPRPTALRSITPSPARGVPLTHFGTLWCRIAAWRDLSTPSRPCRAMLRRLTGAPSRRAAVAMRPVPP